MPVFTEVDGRIQSLSAGVINKIAAGEVIERPASVVKELLENAIDALATRIDVDIEAGGADLIRVTDDGEGIHPEDIELAVRAHATSKLRSADDLFHVRTMGFRGEALASISEVSRFRLRSRRGNHETGVEIDVDGGIMKEPRACGCPAGTRVEVRELFLNTPVRRKFLRAPATEFGHIAEQFTRVALACPNLHLTLRHNNKTVFDLPGTGQLAERLELFYGSEFASQLIAVDASDGETRLWGFVGHPSLSKSTRRGQYLFLNGRCIQDRSLQHALGEAYRGLLMTGRHPIAFLYLELPPDDVDVNVHPTKSEVRFRDSQRLYRLVLSTLRTRFLGMDLASGHRLSAGTAPAPETAAVDPERRQQVQRELVDWAKEQLAAWRPDAEWSPAGEEEQGSGVPEAAPEGLPSRSVGESTESDPFAEADVFGAAAGDTVSSPMSQQESSPASPSESLPVSSVVAAAAATGVPTGRAMQILDCYLVLETGDGLTVIDQHALHERILYEQFRRRILAGGIEVQKLLVPITVELSPREAALVIDQQDVLAELGLHVHEFGGTTVSISGYPTLTRRSDPCDLLRAAVEQLEASDGRLSRRDLLDSLMHMMACKAAIKAGQRLAPEEIDSLLALRHMVDDSHHCPHGRPTSLTLSRNELDRQFGRLG